MKAGTLPLEYEGIVTEKSPQAQDEANMETIAEITPQQEES